MAFAPRNDLGSKFAPGNEFAANKSRTLVRSRSAAATSAIEICRTGGLDPIRIQMDAARTLYAQAAKIQQAYPQAFLDQMGQSQDSAGRTIENKTIVDLFNKMLKDAAEISRGVAEFAYPKFQRIHHIGDAPSGPVNQKVVVTLNIGDRPAQSPNPAAAVTIEHEAAGRHGDQSEL